MRTRTRYLSIAALLVAALPVASTFGSVVVYSNNFESETIGSAPAGWSANGGLAVSTVADTSTGGVGSTQSMDLTQTNSPGTGVPEWTAITLPSTVTLADGDSVSLSFVVAALGTPALTAGDRKFRFGIYDGLATTEGYGARLDVGGDATSSTADVWSSVGILGASTTSTPAGKSLGTSTNTAAQINDTNTRTIVMTLTRSGANIIDSVSITPTGGATVTVSGTDSTTSVRTDTGYSFNQIQIGQSGGSPADFRIDNLSVTYSGAAPEPASLSLLAVSVLPLLARRRKH